MKNLFASCFIVFMLSSLASAEFLVLKIEERVKTSNLIVIGKLTNVSETETETFINSKGTLVVEKVIDGNFVSLSGPKLKTGDEIEVDWHNSKMMACRFGFTENEAEIWFLSVDRQGKLKSLSPGTTAALSELTEVKNHLKNRKREKKDAGKIKLRGDLQEVAPPNSIDKPAENAVRPRHSIEIERAKFYPVPALLVALASLSLYYFLYRSRFKIR